MKSSVVPSVLGIHRDPWHDTGAALVFGDHGYRRIIAVSEERLNREKDSRKFPNLAIEACLKSANIGINEVNTVCSDYIVRPEWDNDWHRKKSVDAKEYIDISAEKQVILNHHLCHAAAVVYTSGFSSSAILVIDGRGSDKETQSLFYFDGTEIRLVEKSDCIGIGLLYAAVTQKIGFKLLQEGKTMGLAPYGEEEYKAKGPIFDFQKTHNGIVSDYSCFCEEGSYGIRADGIDINKFEDKARAAYQVQKECESEMIRLAKYAKEMTSSQNLCITGGVGLNSVANMKILSEQIFDNIYINPCCSDTGIPLGAALYGYHVINEMPYMETLSSTAYLGPEHSSEEVLEALEEIDSNIYDVIESASTQELLKTMVDDLTQGRIIGVCHGRAEIGPRALGNRSILMNATKGENKDILNKRVKHREPFRPFAPICLEEYASDYFDIEIPCPYMLFVPKVNKDKQDIIPACTHVDGSARLQTVSGKEKTIVRSILEEYKRKTDIPVLLNTSFNDNNEPIVDSPQDAISCLIRCDLDGVLMTNTYVRRKQ